jgi:uncharacterized cupin superfamily protein
MADPNLFQPEFEIEFEREGFAGRRAKLGKAAGAEHLGASLYELAPGCAAFPLHYHLGNEELMVIVEGSAVLRTLEGERALEPGEVVAFPIGEEGAHQVVNRGSEPVRMLIISEMNTPDVVVRPESGKVNVFGRPPGSDAEGLNEVFFRRDASPFWEGEPVPPAGDATQDE